MLQDQAQPWEELAELIRNGNPVDVSRFVRELPAGETARILSRLGEDDRGAVLRWLDAPQAASLIEEIPEVQAAEMIEQLEPQEAAQILHELPSDEQADLLSEIKPQDAEAIFAEMEPAEAHEVRHLADYPSDVAGGLMVTEFFCYPENVACGTIASDLRQMVDEYADSQLQYVYVTSVTGELLGVLRLRDLRFTQEDTPPKVPNLPATLFFSSATLGSAAIPFFTPIRGSGAHQAQKEGRQAVPSARVPMRIAARPRLTNRSREQPTDELGSGDPFDALDQRCSAHIDVVSLAT